MDATVVQAMLKLIKSAVDGAQITAFDAEMLPQLHALAKSHDMAHLVAEALDRAGQLPHGEEYADQLRRARFTAIFRQEQFTHALVTIQTAFETEKIPFLPLKGAVIRTLYPEPWMRTSCDIDILVNEEDAVRAVACLTARHGFTLEGKGSHDYSLHDESGVHIELHYTLVEEHIPPAVQAILRSVWIHAAPCDGSAYHYTMSDAFFYFYHIAHMAKHFELGGCGIRPLLDLWLLEGQPNPAPQEREALLQAGGLSLFAAAARRLAAVWFAGAAHDDITARMQTFILRGGVYGTLENQIAVARKTRGGKLGYAFSKVFLPYRVLKYQYPVLQKHKWLTPVCQVRRWFRLLLGGHTRRVAHTLRVNGNLTASEVRAARSLFDELGL